ncbi:hypothetical protein EDB83DRAFT_2322594 [Lactarius deliciosus]|nr:hypothetical protein EDB83DRAFT_2322594 [Lactarius deliciosus]
MITGLTLNRMEVSLKVSHGEESLRSQDFAWQHDKSLASGTRGGHEYQGCEIKHSRYGSTFVEWESSFAVLGILLDKRGIASVKSRSGGMWKRRQRLIRGGTNLTSNVGFEGTLQGLGLSIQGGSMSGVEILRTPSKACMDGGIELSVRSTSRELAGQAETRNILREPSTSTRGLRSWNSEAWALYSFVLEALVWWFPLSYGTFRDWYIIHPPFQSSSVVCINATGAFVAQHRPKPLRPIILGGLVICVTSVFISSLVTKPVGFWKCSLANSCILWWLRARLCRLPILVEFLLKRLGFRWMIRVLAYYARTRIYLAEEQRLA